MGSRSRATVGPPRSEAALWLFLLAGLGDAEGLLGGFNELCRFLDVAFAVRVIDAGQQAAQFQAVCEN